MSNTNQSRSQKSYAAAAYGEKLAAKFEAQGRHDLADLNRREAARDEREGAYWQVRGQ